MIQVRHTLSAASLPSITEFSEPISEADEIESVLHLQKLGDEAFHRKNFHQAVTFYSDALEIDEEHAQLLSRRAIANSHLRNYKQAQRDAEILVKFNPHVSKVEHWSSILAMCYEKLDKPKQAISSYLKAIQLDNKHRDRQTDRLAQVVSRLCKKTNLVINLDKALSSQLMVIGETLAKDGFPRSGVEVFQAVISLRPVDRGEELDAHFLMACCFLDNKEYEKALDSFRQCLHWHLVTSPGYTVRCYLRMARICFTIEEYEDGVVYARKVISLCEDDQDQRDDEKKKEKFINMWQEMKEWLVLAYRALGDMGTALEQAELYLSSIDSNSQDREIASKAHLLIGFLREGNGQYLEALDSYQEFLEVSKRVKTGQHG
ncbi:putative tetratricopeptide repeat protein 28 [Apostichopus japonicus]|uniref:Putative tetratricopeptide repeat protein 28 n=1 Tax=Stichopus japonicus TaxID=307972 RepID=A0A2G8K0K4_STIJA|nr:putative tetratricopeptide repeat protein 28 [Apostichopus japonicus]